MENTDKNLRPLEILLVDDDKILNMLHRMRLEDSDIENPIITCSNGKAAIEYLKSKKSSTVQFLILLDLNMPEMNGWE